MDNSSSVPSSSSQQSANIIQRFFGHLENIISNDNVRWVILFLFVLASYAYVFYQAFLGPTSDEESKQMAYLFNPSAGGYRVIRGDMSSPSLFEWDKWEYWLLSVAGIMTVVLFYKFVWQNEKNTPWYIRSIEFILAWSHSVIVLFFLPVNKFHTRMLYNLRSVTAAVCNDALKELWLAFLFIVLLPLPGSRSHSERITWMALKLGIFYIVQNILLGSPNYKTEPYTDNKILPESGSEMLGYGIFLAVVFVLLGWENLSQWKTNTWATMSDTQKRTRIIATISSLVVIVCLVVPVVVIKKKASSSPPSPSPPSP